MQVKADEAAPTLRDDDMRRVAELAATLSPANIDLASEFAVVRVDRGGRPGEFDIVIRDRPAMPPGEGLRIYDHYSRDEDERAAFRDRFLCHFQQQHTDAGAAIQYE